MLPIVAVEAIIIFTFRGGGNPSAPHSPLYEILPESILSTKMSGNKEVPILRANESWIFDTGWLEGELFGLLL